MATKKSPVGTKPPGKISTAAERRAARRGTQSGK